MRKRIAKIVCSMTAIVTLLSAPVFPKTAVSAETKKPVVVVSLGDSYSAGEGIEPFYGQKTADGSQLKSYDRKVGTQDWLAHRSTESWPGKVKIPGVSGTLSDYKVTGENQKWKDECRWYFAASSGAKTNDLYSDQIITTKKDLISEKVDRHVSRQFNAFDAVKSNGDTVDYVTMTIGGNDVGFVDIVTDWYLGSNYLAPAYCKLENRINEIWADWDSVYAPKIKNAYLDTYYMTNEQADIIIAGYPQLLTCEVTGYNLYEIPTWAATTLVRQSITEFNGRLEQLVEQCNEEKKTNHFHFVSVEDKFNGHEAYSDKPWINEILFGQSDEDWVHPGLAGRSMHPNTDGAQVYAGCVSTAISEIEKKKAEQADGTPVYGITGAEWVVDPTIEADDIIVGDRFSGFSASVSCPYVYIRRDGKYGLIGYDGNIAVKPEYDSFNGNGFYGLDEFIAVYDSKSGDSIFAETDLGGNGKWKIVERKNAFGQPGIGSSATTYFINENDGELYRFNTFNEKPEEITDGPDTSYIVQKINCVVSGYNIGKSSAADEKFYLYNDLKGEMLTDGYKYVCTNGHGTCTYSGAVGSRVMTDGYKTAAFSNDMKKWDIYDSYGVLIAKDLEPFDCNLDLTTSWAPATSFFDDANNYDSAKNTHGKAVPFCATEGYIAAKKDGKCGYLDLDGNEVVPFGILEDVRPVHDGKAWAKFEGKWGVLSFETVS